MPNDNKHMLPLNNRQQKFVREYASGKNATESLKDAGYNPASHQNAKIMASQLLGRPDVRNALACEIERLYPDLTTKVSTVLSDLLEDPLIRVGDRLKVIELLMKVCGWHAPTKHASVSLKIKPKLPED